MRKTKVVVFDFDNTLYNNIIFDDWKTYCNNALREILNFLSKEQIEDVISKQTDYSEVAIINTLKKFNVPCVVWTTYRDEKLRNFDISNAVVISNEVLREFAEKYVLYIVTFNTKKHVKVVSEKIGIDLSIFKDIIKVDNVNEISNKKFLYEKIIKNENIKPENLFVIGDKFETDIVPAIEIGAKGKLVENVFFTIKDFDL